MTRLRKLMIGLASFVAVSGLSVAVPNAAHAGLNGCVVTKTSISVTAKCRVTSPTIYRAWAECKKGGIGGPYYAIATGPWRSSYATSSTANCAAGFTVNGGKYGYDVANS